MAVVADISGQSPPVVGGSSMPPLPVILGLIGGGLGLIVFLNRKAQSGGSSGKQTLLPNTAIMLGSLQEGVLNLQGQIGQNQADLSSQLTGVGENIGTQLDAQSQQLSTDFAGVQQGFSSLSQQVTDANGQVIGAVNGVGSQVTQIGHGQDALATAIGNSATNQASAYSQLLGLYNSLLTLIHAQNQQVAAAAAAAPVSSLPVVGQIGHATQELSSGVGTTPRVLSGDRGFTFHLSPDQSKIIVDWQNLQDQSGSFFNFQNDKDIWATTYAISNRLGGTSGEAVIDLGSYRLDPNQDYRIVQVQPSQGGAGNHFSFAGHQLL